MLEDAGVQVVLSEERLLSVLGDYSGRVVCLDREDEEIGRESCAELKSGVSDENLAYVIYTSGSTGRPKGVMVEHGGLAHYLGHAAAEYLPPEISGSVVSSPLSFDATLTTLLTPLLVGRSVELLADDERLMEQLAERLFAVKRTSCSN
jgi:non-ribosomal peptide synthetase component F